MSKNIEDSTMSPVSSRILKNYLNKEETMIIWEELSIHWGKKKSLIEWFLMNLNTRDYNNLHLMLW